MSDPWKILYTKQGLKDKKTAMSNGLKAKVRDLLALLKDDPFAAYPPYEKLIGDLGGACSRRLNRQHRLVYQAYEVEHAIKIISFWSHYE